jgi:SAM-dependent methyltransferase
MDKQEKLALIKKYFYPNSLENLWFKIVSENCRDNSDVLEIGSGSGDGLQNQLYPNARSVSGIDLDERILTNPHLSKAKVGSAYELVALVEDQKFDMIYSHMVAEHIEDAETFLTQQLQCLKANGVIIHSTVSKYYWTSLLNDVMPPSWKNFLIKHLGSGRAEVDIFPAHYTLNSDSALKALAAKLGFTYRLIRQDEPPGYLRRSLILMVLYTIIHKPLQYIFPALRPTFIFVVER